MKQNFLKAIIIIAVIVIMVIVVGTGLRVFYLLSGFQENQTTGPITIEQQMVQIKKDYPEIITGVINFFDKDSIYKAVLTTDQKKEYIMWPPQPVSIYSIFGAKEGQKIEVQGRVNNQGNLEWGMIKPIVEP